MKINIMSKETAALSSVDDISQGGIDSVDISNYGGISAAVACGMSLSKREDTISEEKCTSCDQKIDNIKTNDIEVDNTSSNAADIVSEDNNSGTKAPVVCANCGKEGASNTCNKCKMVKYCNAACKKKHKTKHKKACERRVAELHDEQLFKQLPTIDDDCPICFQPLPFLDTGRLYQSCCGKIICSGCIYAPVYDDKGNAMDNKICPFCRATTPDTNEEIIKRLQKRVELNDAQAITLVGSYYSEGMFGLPQDYDRAMKLLKQAAELDNAAAYVSIGNAYYLGRGVEVDTKKALHYWEVAAMRGNAAVRHSLAVNEENSGNTERAIKHYMIAASGGINISLKRIKVLYSNGHATKDEYSKALQAYQKYLIEVKSSQRDEAAAAREDYKYID